MKFLHLTFMLFCIQFCLGQNVDSLVTEQKLTEQSDRLLKIKEQQTQDSLRRVQLENRLFADDLEDTKEKQALLTELYFLKNRDSLAFAERKRKVDSMRVLNPGIPVKPFKDTLFTIYRGIGGFSIRERANAVQSRVKNLADLHSFHADSIRVLENEDTWYITGGNEMIMSVSEEDALWMNAAPAALADLFATKIRGSIEQYRDDTSIPKLMKGIGLAALVLFIVSLIVYGINKLAGYTRRLVLRNKGNKLTGIRISGYELVSATKQVRFVWALFNLIKWAFILMVIYLALPIVFNLFPATEGFANVLLSYILDPIKKISLAIINYFPNLITVVVIVIIFRYIFKILKYFANELHRGALNIPGFYADWTLPTYQILRVLLTAFMLIVIFPYLPGSKSPIFQGVSVFIGILFTFGSAGALGNVVAGLVITYMRPFSIGDRVKIGDVQGDIIEKTLLVTRLRTIKNEIISVPNSQVMNSHTINYSTDAPLNGLIVHTTLTIGYDIPWQTVHKLAIEAALNVEYIEADPTPFVLQTSLDDYYVSYQINGYTKQPNKQAIIYSELHKNLLDEFHGAGIEIMSPHYRVVRSNEDTAMPPADER
ncbi:mechanosensitive ion channel family protein [Sphingobacterium pedocola]|uniref:Transmembrane ion channel n=1 Tax=Sphingobacterium pedocola TaxID=2082722 RepID=A0ABR9T576_9SPHI|nr:mechanosensitive ion channel family protein [Sphingobacterium pedocola]MBE8720497.1 transmembrane ion channel [Sphingobacterium pedocola]